MRGTRRLHLETLKNEVFLSFSCACWIIGLSTISFILDNNLYIISFYLVDSWCLLFPFSILLLSPELLNRLLFVHRYAEKLLVNFGLSVSAAKSSLYFFFLLVALFCALLEVHYPSTASSVI